MMCGSLRALSSGTSSSLAARWLATRCSTGTRSGQSSSRSVAGYAAAKPEKSDLCWSGLVLASAAACCVYACVADLHHLHSIVRHTHTHMYTHLQVFPHEYRRALADNMLCCAVLLCWGGLV